MPDLSFQVESVEAVPFAAAPLVIFKVCLSNAIADEPVHSVVLRCQIRIEPSRRRYHYKDQEKLLDLFGEPDRWSQTMRSMLWTQANAVAPAFTNSAIIDLPVPCSFDFNIAATKYFEGLEDGDIP